jgi:hypothetical protein
MSNLQILLIIIKSCSLYYLSNHFIENSMRTYPYKRHVVQVWKKHQDSVKWLNMLKFYPFASYHVGAEEILLVERKRT